jgi:DNA-binding LacI/PurR family transcriptional regulator
VEWAIPALTTVRQPLSEMTASAAGMVITPANGGQLTGKRLIFATDLLLRASTSSPGR